MTRKTLKTGAFVLLLIIAAFTASYAGARLGTRNTAAEEVPAREAARSISIPGFERLTLAAGQIEQTANFYNPSKNDCRFMVSLSIDGKEVFSSDLIDPGGSLSNISLYEPLTTGTYDGILRYSCYELDSMDELNGADIALQVEVIP